MKIHKNKVVVAMKLLLGIMLLVLNVNAYQKIVAEPSLQPPTAMYFFHVGESDKPLPTFVFALKQPESTDLVEIIGEPFWRYTDVFIVQGEALEKAEKIVQDSLTSNQGVQAGISHSYGSFKVTILRDKSKESIYLNYEQSILTFRQIIEHISPSQQQIRQIGRAHV